MTSVTSPAPRKAKPRGIVDDGPDVPKIVLFYCVVFFANVIALASVLMLEAYWPQAGGGWFYAEAHPAGLFTALSIFFLLSAIITFATLCISWRRRALIGYVLALALAFTISMPFMSFMVPVRDNPVSSFKYWFEDDYYDMADPEEVYHEITETDAETVTVKAEKKDDKDYKFDVIWNEDHTGFQLVQSK